jgi:hypothetical protein
LGAEICLRGQFCHFCLHASVEMYALLMSTTVSWVECQISLAALGSTDDSADGGVMRGTARYAVSKQREGGLKRFNSQQASHFH